MTLLGAGLDFALPEANVATEPPEARGLARDAVRLMVSRVSEDRVSHGRFHDLARVLRKGDLLVVNASATFAASLPAVRLDAGSEAVLLHLSTPLPGDSAPSTPLPAGRWVFELRRRTTAGSRPLLDAEVGERLALPGGGAARLLGAYGTGERAPLPGRVRLWIAELGLPVGDMASYTALHGSPIRYGYVPDSWPLARYQTVFSEVPGSAEMPSAGRPFTPELVERLTRSGVGVARILLHTGVSSLDADEAPYPERFQVPAATAAAVNGVRAAGGRVIAVGTTSVRAIESAVGDDGVVRPAQGWTDLVVTPERGVRALHGILTGLHAPEASHLAMLEAFAGKEHLEQAYQTALGQGYLWHEFGDSHLILP